MSIITGSQIRAARAALRWSATQLAERANVAMKTIARFEQLDGVPSSRLSTLISVRVALESAGVEFIGTPDDGPGIRLRRKGD
jgi:transcriptional regulator with XRE-family HTH domain